MNTFDTQRELRPLSSGTSTQSAQRTVDIDPFNSSAARETGAGGQGAASRDNQQDLRNSTSSSYRQAIQKNPSSNPPTLQQRRIDAELASHVHHLSPNPNAFLKPVDPSWRLSSSPNPSPTRSEFTNFTPVISSSNSKNIDPRNTEPLSSPSLLMRTPPPTAKRKEKKIAIQAKDTLSSRYREIEAMPSSEQRTPRHTVFPTSLQDQSPQLFSTNPFSPNALDIFGHDSSMPMTAPVYSGKSFWDPNFHQGSPNLQQDGMIGSMNNEAPQDASFSWFASPQTRLGEAIDHPDLHSQLKSKGAESFMTSSSGVQQPSSFMFNVSQSTQNNRSPGESSLSTDGVDPSLLFGPLSINTDSLPVGDFSVGPDSGYPSVSQAAFNSTKLKRLSGGSKVNFQGNTQRIRPSVKRRATDTATENRTMSHNIIGNGGHNVQLNKISDTRTEQNRSRSSRFPPTTERGVSFNLNYDTNALPVSLTIDASGRAYMEPSVPGARMGQPRLRRHRGLDLDGESSSTSSDTSSDNDDLYTRSRHASFSNSFNTPRHSKQFGVPSRKTGSLKRSRPSSARIADVDSPAVSALSSNSNESFSKERSQRQKGTNGFVSFSDLSFNSNRVGGSDEGSNPSNDPGDAQHALREVIERRSTKRDSLQSAEAALSRSRLSRSGQFQALSSSYTASPSQSRHIGSLDCNTGVSPTTITDPDLATPSTDRESSLSESTRCICDVSESGGHLMIQCDSCTKWLHVKCVGLDRRHLPPVYVCVNCTGTTPIVRGGRIREPTRSNINLGSSPLARKGHRSRRD